MAEIPLTKQALFQVNTMIWTVMPLPGDAPNKPVLAEHGYSLLSIERPLTAPPTARTSPDESSPPIRANPTADLILAHEETGHYVIVECKASSFGASATAAEQARGFLVAGGDIARRGLGITQGTAEVCYVLPEENRALQHQTLTQCSAEVVAAGFVACDFGELGIMIRDDGVYLRGDDSSAVDTVGAHCSPEVRVRSLDEEEDPRPLYIVPWLPGVEPEALDELREKLRTVVIARLGTAGLGDIEWEYIDLINAVSFNVFEQWEDHDSLRGQVFPQVGAILRNLFATDARLSIRQRNAVVTIDSQEDREALIELARKFRPKNEPAGIQLSLDRGRDRHGRGASPGPPSAALTR